MSDKIRVLVVDDSILVRKIISDMLESDPAIVVAGTAKNGREAIDRTVELDPDVITMDIEMPVMDGLAALKTIIEKHPRPVIMMSVLTQHGAEATFKALEYGAVDFVPKPSSVLSLSVDEIKDLLIGKVKSVYKSKVSSASETERIRRISIVGRGIIPDFDSKSSSNKIVGIGTSTGGPSALLTIFKNLPRNFPSSILVVQHMPEGFTRAFSERLNSVSHLSVKEAEDGDRVMPGCGFVAPGNSHIALETRHAGMVIRVFDGEKVSGHRPSIDVLFNSLAENVGKNTVGVIMTGMGRDGADGIYEIRKRGGRTVAQNEETSVVFGMNRVAVQKGAIEDVVPLDDIPKKIVEYI